MVHLQPLIKRDKICQTLTKRIERALKLQKREWTIKIGSEELRTLLLMWQAQLIEK